MNQESKPFPLVSIVILSWNRKEELEHTLKELREQTYLNRETTIVDNNSADGTCEMVENQFPEVKLIKLPRNIGIEGYNIGFKNAKGKYILVLDDDSYPSEANGIKKAVDIFEKEKSENIGILAFKIKTLTGEVVTQSWVGYRPSFWGCGGMILKEVLEKIGYYNESLFLYGNEACLSIRVWNAGYKVIYCPEVTIFHKVSTKHRSWKRYGLYAWRGEAWFNLKYFSFRFLPALIIRNLFTIFRDGFVKYKSLEHLFFSLIGYLKGYVLFLSLGKKKRLPVSLKIQKFYLAKHWAAYPIFHRFMRKIFKTKFELRKYKLLFILPTLAGGGAERVTLNLISNLSQDNFAVCLALLNKKGRYSIPVSVNKVYDLGKKGRWSFPFLVWKMLMIFYKESPTIVFSVLDASHYVVYFARLFSLLRIPWIINDHSVQSRAIGIQNFSKIKKWVVKRAYSSANRIVVVSNSVKEDLVSNFEVNSNKVSVIYNSIEIEKIKLLSNESVEHSWFKEAVPIIISVGRYEEAKGYEFLIKSFSVIINSIKTRLVLIGEGRKEKILKNLVKDLGIEENVMFLPFQKNPWKYVKNSTIFAVSSIWEGFSLVTFEAMICETPIVATKCGGIPEIIKNNETGLLVPPQSVDALSDSIKKLLKDEMLRKRLTENAKEWVEKFDSKKIFFRYEEIFKEVGMYGAI